jgi:uncharacterized protein
MRAMPRLRLVILRRTLAAVLVLLVLVGAAFAAPPLWKVEGPKGTLYVLGTMHRLPGGAVWFDERLQGLLLGSDELILETTSSQAATDYLALIASKPGVVFTKRALNTLLAPDTESLLRQRLAAFGASVETLDSWRPWYAGIMLSVLSSEDAGLYARNGSETILEAFAEAHGLPRVGLETAAFQLLLFADLPRKAEVDFLLATLKETDNYRERAQELTHAWLEGDLEATERLVLGPLLENPPLYEALIARRNRAWVKELSRYLEKKGTAFVAVGAGHLVGPDSVLTQLARKGYRVTRE